MNHYGGVEIRRIPQGTREYNDIDFKQCPSCLLRIPIRKFGINRATGKHGQICQKCRNKGVRKHRGSVPGREWSTPKHSTEQEEQ